VLNFNLRAAGNLQKMHYCDYDALVFKAFNKFNSNTFTNPNQNCKILKANFCWRRDGPSKETACTVCFCSLEQECQEGKRLESERTGVCVAIVLAANRDFQFVVNLQCY
jgi:hypothetical protein